MNATPSTKTYFTIFASAIVTIITWILTSMWGIELPDAVGAAAVTVVAGLIAYFVPAKQGTYVHLAQDDGFLPDEDIEVEYVEDQDDDYDEDLEDYDEDLEDTGPVDVVEEAK